jgi:ornithine lipid hydroxylase
VVIYVIIVGGGLTLGILGIEHGYSPTLVIGVLGAAAIAAIMVLERLRPHEPGWNRSRGDLLPDAIHMLVSGMASTQLAVVLLGTGNGRFWPTDWPLVAQFPLALVVGELGMYWAHRLLHERALGWRFHAVHHSAERLYWLNGMRNHPVDAFFQYFALMAPIVLLGAGADVLALIALYPALHTPLQHSNIAVRAGPLSLLLSTPELHRWHHARGPIGNVNYGASLVIWDHVFGTYRRPPDECREVGLEAGATYPRGYLDQLAEPFRARRNR